MLIQSNIQPSTQLRVNGLSVIRLMLLAVALILQSVAVNAQDSTRIVKKVIEGKRIKIQIYNNDGDTIIKEYDINTQDIGGDTNLMQKKIIIDTQLEMIDELTEEAMEKMEEQLEEMEERLEEQMEELEEQLEEVEELDHDDAMDKHKDELEKQMQELHLKLKGLHHDNDHDKSRKSKVKTVKQSWFVMDWGWNVWLTDNTFDLPEDYKEMELDRGSSANFHLSVIQQGVNIYKGRLRFVYGIGVEFNNYRFNEDIDLIDGSKPLDYTVNADRKYKKNKLVSQYATMPLMLNYKTHDDKDSESFKISAGIQLGYLVKSHTKQKWGDDGKREKSKIRGNYSFSEYRIGYVLQFGYGDFNIYGKYYPTEVFKSGEGPVANTAAIGLVLTPF